jgi:hypothetical protein
MQCYGTHNLYCSSYGAHSLFYCSSYCTPLTAFFLLQAHDKLTGMSINNVAQIMQKTLALVKPLAEGGGADRQLLKTLQAGLAIKNPPKKTHLNKPTKNVFLGFF